MLAPFLINWRHNLRSEGWSLSASLILSSQFSVAVDSNSKRMRLIMPFSLILVAGSRVLYHSNRVLLFSAMRSSIRLGIGGSCLLLGGTVASPMTSIIVAVILEASQSMLAASFSGSVLGGVPQLALFHCFYSLFFHLHLPTFPRVC